MEPALDAEATQLFDRLESRLAMRRSSPTSARTAARTSARAAAPMMAASAAPVQAVRRPTIDTRPPTVTVPAAAALAAAPAGWSPSWPSARRPSYFRRLVDRWRPVVELVLGIRRPAA